MTILALVFRSLFRDKDGGDAANTTIIKHRFLSRLIWQFLTSTFLLFLTTPLFYFVSLKPSYYFSIIVTFLPFHISLLLFSTSVFSLSSPQPHPSATPSTLFRCLTRFLVSIISSGSHAPTVDEKRRVRVTLGLFLFVICCGVSGFIGFICVCSGSDERFEMLGFKGFLVGAFYGVHYVYHQRWVLQFPIIQRPPFFSFKMGLPSAIRLALKLSAAGYLFLAFLTFFLPTELKRQFSLGKLVAEQIISYTGSFVLLLCWELSHLLNKVLHTKRYTFAPPKGSAAAETNPSEPLLAALEESTPRSLLQYLAFLDLCMVCESNVDTWRRAAFFEETSETYKRVIAVCLRPLEQLTAKVGEGLESCSVDNSLQLSHQLRSPTEALTDSRFYESFYDFQLCAWCARIVASLTAHSRKEDRFGVAQLSGSNAAVISTLISSLLAVESLMGKKTSLQPSQYLMGPAGIKWATVSTGRSDSAASVMSKRRGSPIYAKAFSMADLLRTSIYSIVSTFHDEMLNSAKRGHLEKDWVIDSKPLYGTRELLLQKLRLFLDFRAS